MYIAKQARAAGNVAIACMTSRGSQNFLGAPWIARLVENSPDRIQENVALRLLALSPHYFYDRDMRAEAERNRRSRRALVEALVSPHLTDTARVIDYGCGPGYMARAVADKARHVTAVDISPGVLACAKKLNGCPNIDYLTPAQFRLDPVQADLAYSFAVVQHVRTEVLTDVLRLLAGKLRPGGILLLHFAIPGQQGWRTEAEWKADRSLAGRVKLRYGLNCFGRSVSEMESLVSGCGFADATVQSLAGNLPVACDDDITQQHLLTARRR
jgi:SAM-dependent methyltransferase